MSEKEKIENVQPAPKPSDGEVVREYSDSSESTTFEQKIDNET